MHNYTESTCTIIYRGKIPENNACVTWKCATWSFVFHGPGTRGPQNIFYNIPHSFSSHPIQLPKQLSSTASKAVVSSSIVGNKAREHVSKFARAKLFPHVETSTKSTQRAVLSGQCGPLTWPQRFLSCACINRTLLMTQSITMWHNMWSLWPASCCPTTPASFGASYLGLVARSRGLNPGNLAKFGKLSAGTLLTAPTVRSPLNHLIVTTATGASLCKYLHTFARELCHGKLGGFALQIALVVGNVWFYTI